MRISRRVAISFLAAVWMMHAADHEAIAGTVVPAAAVAKLFTKEVSAKYIVVAVTVSPAPGEQLDVHLLDFLVKTRGGGRSRPANPEEVASVWGQGRPSIPLRRQTIESGGVAYSADNLPPAHIANSPSVYSQGTDSKALEKRLREHALPMGLTNHSVAGYLYLPIAGPRKSANVAEFAYTPRNGEAISLPVR